MGSNNIIMGNNLILKNIAVIIPAYEPNNILLDYVLSLEKVGFEKIIIVDDGSGDSFREIFSRIKMCDNVTILTHPVNMGKGTAIKTGLKYILESLNNVEAIITADSDGQHSLEDCVRLCNTIMNNCEGLVLGCRNFSSNTVPWKSRFGNKTTSFVFRLISGRWINDTQTGLRGFKKEMIPVMLSISGTRYEYEMNVLLEIIKTGIPIHTIEIQTIYENNNKGTHFKAIVDSFRIYKVLLHNFILFSTSSIACSILDQLIAFAIGDIVLPNIGVSNIHAIVWISGCVSRIVSSIANFTINRVVFQGSTENLSLQMWRYFVLCIVIIMISNVGVVLMMHTGVLRWVSKLILDVSLYVIGYNVQKKWIFSKK